MRYGSISNPLHLPLIRRPPGGVLVGVQALFGGDVNGLNHAGEEAEGIGVVVCAMRIQRQRARSLRFHDYIQLGAAQKGKGLNICNGGRNGNLAKRGALPEAGGRNGLKGRRKNDGRQISASVECTEIIVLTLIPFFCIVQRCKSRKVLKLIERRNGGVLRKGAVGDAGYCRGLGVGELAVAVGVPVIYADGLDGGIGKVDVAGLDVDQPIIGIALAPILGTYERGLVGFHALGGGAVGLGERKRIAAGEGLRNKDHVIFFSYHKGIPCLRGDGNALRPRLYGSYRTRIAVHRDADGAGNILVGVSLERSRDYVFLGYGEDKPAADIVETQIQSSRSGDRRVQFIGKSIGDTLLGRRNGQYDAVSVAGVGYIVRIYTPEMPGAHSGFRRACSYAQSTVEVCTLSRFGDRCRELTGR